MNTSSVFHPSMPLGDLIVTSVADERYLKYIRPLVKSLFLSNPTIPVHLRLIQVEQSVAAELLQVNPNTIITHDNAQYSDIKNRFPIPAGKWDWDNVDRQTIHPKLVSDKMCHCVQVKYKDISRLLDEGYKTVFSVDSDTIVRKSLTALKCDIERHDILIMDNITRDSVKYSRSRAGWKEGAIGVNNTYNNSHCNQLLYAKFQR